MNLLWRFAALLLLLGGLLLAVPVACIPENVTETEVRVYVGTNGGTVLGPRGSRLIIPHGVLDAVTEFSLIQMETEEIPENDDFERRSIAVVIQPADVDFSEPLTVQLSYGSSGLSAVQQRSRLAVFRMDEGGEEWKMLESSVILETNEIRAQSQRLGVFAAFFNPQEPDDDPHTDDDPFEPADCSCYSWLGLFCRDADGDAACSDLAAFHFEAVSTTDCRTRLAGFDEEGEPRFVAEVAGCGPEYSPVFTRPEIGDCELSFDAEQASLVLSCGDCSDFYHVDGACPPDVLPE